MDLEIQTDTTKNPVVLTLRGNLVAGIGAQLSQALSTISSQQVIFDLADITIINSSGIGEWAEFLQEHMTGKRFWFRRCTPNIVDTINLLPSFLAHGNVESMFVDFQCNKCSSEVRVEVNVLRDVTPAGEMRRKLNCDNCKKVMNTLFPEDDLFSFLSQK